MASNLRFFYTQLNYPDQCHLKVTILLNYKHKKGGGGLFNFKAQKGWLKTEGLLIELLRYGIYIDLICTNLTT